MSHEEAQENNAHEFEYFKRLLDLLGLTKESKEPDAKQQETKTEAGECNPQENERSLD